MRLLILGGTRFVGRAIVETAVARGHTVTLFNRGSAGPGLFPNLETIKGDREKDVSALKGHTWDAVIDVSGYFPRHVRMTAETLRGAHGLYAFVSTVSVYADYKPGVVTESHELAKTDNPTAEIRGGPDYGALKALCELEVQKAYPKDTLIVRPGLVVGPHDPTNRFTYWVTRMAEGGDVLAPAPKERPVQFIDTRDLAAFTVARVEAGARDVYNGTGPAAPLTMADMLETCRQRGVEATLTWVAPEFLVEQKVTPYTEMPVWLPDSEKRPLFSGVSIDKALATGLKHRPLRTTVADTLAWSRSEKNPPNGTAMTRQRERELLALWRKQA
jgi:2'-hydroxyisoflavone reductase